jgi:hypothetical protein
MEKITSIAELRISILLLEIKQANEMTLLKEQFNITIIGLKPGNLIKNKFHDIVSSPDLKENILSTALGLAVGYLSKKAIVGSTHNPLKQLLGTLLQVGVTGIVSKNSDGIKSVASKLIGTFLNKKSISN